MIPIGLPWQQHLPKQKKLPPSNRSALIILDAEISEQPIDDIIQQMLQMHPLARFLIIRPESAPEWIPDIPNPFSVIQRPFFISNVLEQADTLLLMDSVEREPPYFRRNVAKLNKILLPGCKTGNWQELS